VPPPAEYAPQSDGRPDPGEVVWTWVAYEEDASRGKDRPVLVLAREGAELLCLQLTSKDHDRDAAQEASWGRHWTDVGPGGWDRERRPSEVRLDKVLRVREPDVRREGAALDRAIFDRVVQEASAFHPELVGGAATSAGTRLRPRRGNVTPRRPAPAVDGAALGRQAARLVVSLLRRRR
jgi:PemK-like, MazF-like toxin of type II toxin-antitoxin system